MCRTLVFLVNSSRFPSSPSWWKWSSSPWVQQPAGEQGKGMVSVRGMEGWQLEGQAGDGSWWRKLLNSGPWSGDSTSRAKGSQQVDGSGT